LTDQRAIPFMHMRGGTSKGPVFNKKDLPEDRDTLAKVLISATGSGHQINIDGIGAGNSVTTKVPILSKSDDDWADVDYFFVQVQALEHVVDFNTTCGNMLSTVASAALRADRRLLAPGMCVPAGSRSHSRRAGSALDLP